MSATSVKTRILVEGAVAAALSLALSYLKLFTMPQGGSITLEMAPLLTFALLRGPRAGIAAGAVSGLLQALFGGYVVHPAQALLDYPLAFGALGLAGLLPGRPLAGCLLGGSLRLLCHVLSGVIFFASFAPKGTNVWIYSLAYNGSFLVPSLILSGLLALLTVRRLAALPQRG
jgi:thiamine transporter